MAPTPTAQDNLAMTIGMILKRRRLVQGETLEDVAYRAGTDPSNLSRIERGLQQPSVALLEALSLALGAKVSDIYREHESLDDVLQVEEPSPPAGWEIDIHQLTRHFRGLNSPNRELVIEFCKLLKSQQ